MPNRIRYHAPRLGPPTADHRAAKRERDAFYTADRWRELRARHLAKHPLCVSCQREGITRAANVVHHIKDRLLFPALAFDPTNLESACNSCHTTHHKSKKLPKTSRGGGG